MNPAERHALEHEVVAEIIRTLPSVDARRNRYTELQRVGMTTALAHQLIDDRWSGDYEARLGMLFWLIAQSLDDRSWWIARLEEHGAVCQPAPVGQAVEVGRRVGNSGDQESRAT